MHHTHNRYQSLTFHSEAGGQYVGVHLAAAGVYTGNALLLRLTHFVVTYG